MAQKKKVEKPKGKDVYTYFADVFSEYPLDVSLDELPLESECGKNCKRAIDFGKIYLNALGSDGDHPSVKHPLLISVQEVIYDFLAWVNSQKHSTKFSTGD